MELRQLKHFLAIVDSGSLGDAARRLGISQPTLTRSLQSLEKTVGAELFDRTKQGMVPNQFGRSLEARARSLAADAGRAAREIQELKGVTRGSVTIAASPLFGYELVPDAILQFRADHPTVEITIFEGTISTMFPLVRSGEVDFALCSFAPGPFPADLSAEILLPDIRSSIVTVASHPIAARRHVTAKELWSGPWMLPVRSDSLRKRLDETYVSLGLPPPQLSIGYSTIPMAMNILQRSNCLGLMSNITTHAHVKAGVLRMVRAPELTWNSSGGAVFRRGVPMMPAARKLLETLGKLCGKFRIAS